MVNIVKIKSKISSTEVGGDKTIAKTRLNIGLGL